ncbi:MAG: hypothetical protein ABGX04_17470 [Myxococcales bacterium]
MRTPLTAQNLDAVTLEEIRLLSNLKTDTATLMQIVLTGQPELIRKLASPALRQLRQRIAIEHHMEPLTQEQVHPDLAHRIDVADDTMKFSRPASNPSSIGSHRDARG